MAWTRDITPGKGYTWGGVDRKGSYYNEIDSSIRGAYEANRAKAGGKYVLPWEKVAGRGDIDPKYWVNPGPSYDDRSGYATNTGRNFANPGGIGITATDPGLEFITRKGISPAEDENDKQREFDHSMLSHLRFPSLEMFRTVLDNVPDAFRGSRHKSDYKDRAVAAGFSKADGAKAYQADKMSVMTGYGKKKGDPGYEGSEQAFYDKYMHLYNITSDQDKKRQYKETAEKAWKNQQTTDRLAAIRQFEDYAPGKYTGVGEGARYTGSHWDAPNLVPGYDRIREAYQNINPRGFYYPGQGTGRSMASGQDAIASQMNIPLESAIDYDEWGLAPDPENDLLYGEPGTESIRPEIKPKPSPGEFYEYPDERFLPAPWSPTIDPYEGIYESPLTDLLYGEELIDATPERPLHSKHEFLPRDTVGITRMGGGMNAFPEQSWSDWFWGKDPSYDLTGMDEEEEKFVHPLYPKGKGRRGLYD
jgi:hypothetical protein